MTETHLTAFELDTLLTPEEEMARFKANTTGLYKQVIIQASAHEKFAEILLDTLSVQINSFVGLCFGHNRTVAEISDTLHKIQLLGDTASGDGGAVSIDEAIVRPIDPVQRLSEIIEKSVAFYFQGEK